MFINIILRKCNSEVDHLKNIMYDISYQSAHNIGLLIICIRPNGLSLSQVSKLYLCHWLHYIHIYILKNYA
jgi:hypothetical protein